MIYSYCSRTLAIVLVSLLTVLSVFFYTKPTLAQLGGVTPAPVETVPTPVVEPVQQIVSPPADTTGPGISGVLNVSLFPTTAEIVWTTDELAISGLRYGTSQSLGSSAALPVTALLVHGALLTGLSSSTTYHYCIDATDTSNNVSHSCDHTFTTAATSISFDTNPPTVSLVSVTTITATSATVTWTTNEVADGEVEYGLTSNYDSTTALDSGLTLSHSSTLSQLSPNTTYHYKVRSSDELGNVSVTPDETFTTSPLSNSSSVSSQGGGVSSLVFSSIESSPIAETTATITWNTTLPSDSQIEYGDSELFGSLSPLNSALTTSHSSRYQIFLRTLITFFG